MARLVLARLRGASSSRCALGVLFLSCAWGVGMVFLGGRRFVPTCVGCFTLSCALLLTDCPPSSSHARLRLRPSWPWPCPSASFLPARVLRVHPSRDAPRGEAVPGPAQEPVPYQGAEGHRPPPGKGFELDGWRGWHDGHGAGLRKFIFELSVFRCCSGLLFQSNQYIQQGARRVCSRRGSVMPATVGVVLTHEVSTATKQFSAAVGLIKVG